MLLELWEKCYCNALKKGVVICMKKKESWSLHQIIYKNRMQVVCKHKTLLGKSLYEHWIGKDFLNRAQIRLINWNLLEKIG